MISASDCIELTTFSSAIDLIRTYTKGDEIIALEVVAAAEAGGSMSVTTKGSATPRTLTVASGDRIELQVRTIESVTNVTRVRVLW